MDKNDTKDMQIRMLHKVENEVLRLKKRIQPGICAGAQNSSS